MRKSFEIFIYNYDPFGTSRFLYTFQKRYDEDHALCMNEEAVKIVVNTKGTIGDVNPMLEEVITHLDKQKEMDDYSREMDEAVTAVKGSEERR